MDFTFGIITDGTNDIFIKNLVQSIYIQNIPNYEIIIVGKTSITGNNIINIPFDETVRPAWITKKKNIICQNAKYDNIVLMHDYVLLCDDWYNGFLEFGNNYDICINKIITIDGKRFRDYTINPFGIGPEYDSNALLPYDMESNVMLSKIIYISGTYYIIKKDIALKYPLDENRCWGQSEDIEICKRLTKNNIIIKCNKNSTIQFQKYKGQCIWEKEITSEQIKNILNYSIYDYMVRDYKQRCHLGIF